VTSVYVLLLSVFALVGCTTPTEPAVGMDALRARGRWEACKYGATWYEMPLTTRIYHGRPMAKANGAVADAFVCRGTLRWESATAPSAKLQWLIWSVVADAERRSSVILLILRYPSSNPTRDCVVFRELVNQALRRELEPSQRASLILQSAFAELEGGERWAEDPTSEYAWPINEDGRPLLRPDEPLPRCQEISSGAEVTP